MHKEASRHCNMQRKPHVGFATAAPALTDAGKMAAMINAYFGKAKAPKAPKAPPTIRKFSWET